MSWASSREAETKICETKLWISNEALSCLKIFHTITKSSWVHVLRDHKRSKKHQACGATRIFFFDVVESIETGLHHHRFHQHCNPVIGCLLLVKHQALQCTPSHAVSGGGAMILEVPATAPAVLWYFAKTRGSLRIKISMILNKTKWEFSLTFSSACTEAIHT